MTDKAGPLVDAFYERCGPGGATLRDGPAEPPVGDVNYGAAGIAYAMHRLGRRDDAAAWMNKADALASRDDAFAGGKLAASLWHGAAGLYFVASLAARARGDEAEAAARSRAFVAATRVAGPYDDLTLGRAGLLMGCAELLEAGDDAVRARGLELQAELHAIVEREACATSSVIAFLGMAHGWAGVLYTLIRFGRAAGTPVDRYRAKLDELADLAEPIGLGVRFPESNRTVAEPTYRPGFCHGLAGHALLWSYAESIYGGGRYGELAERAARTAWAWQVALGTLCCGLAGIAYGFAAVHRLPGAPEGLARARLSARFAADDTSEELRRDSLFYGQTGVVLANEELARGHFAFPLVESSS
jgi:serine/threonine-protein kinase